MKKMLKILIAILGIVGLNKSCEVFALDETWGPQDRQTYTWSSPASTATFNSITDNPALGDERNFVRVREYSDDYSDDIEDGLDDDFVDYVDIEPGKEYEVYIYYHNDASETFNTGSGVGIAQNVRLKMEMPEKVQAGETAVIKGTISWGTEGNMQEVWDTAFLKTDETVYLRYVSESGAVIHNRGTVNGLGLDANALFDYGALLAYSNDYWGIIPGCNNYAGYITFRVKADQPKFFIEKEVSADGEDEWGESIEAEPGDILNFRIKYSNIGTTTQTSVRMSDILPDGLVYEEGTMLAVTPNNPGGVNVESKIFDDGLVLGDYEPGEEVVIYYSAKVADGLDECETILYNDAHVATANGTEYDKVKIVVKNAKCETSETTDEIVETGPVEMTLALAIVLVIVISGYYMIRTRILLQKTEDDVMGKK